MSENTWAPLSNTANSHWDFETQKHDGNDPVPYGHGNFVWSEADQKYHQMPPNGSKDNPVVNYSGPSSSSGAPNHHEQVSSGTSSADHAHDNIDLTDRIAVTAPWTEEEDERLKSLVRQGASWNDCAAHLPGRSDVSCQEHFDKLWQRWLDPLSRWCRIEKQRQIEIVNKAARSSKPPATSMQDPPSRPDQTPGDVPQPGPLEVTALNPPVHPGLQKPTEKYPHGFQK